MLRKLLLLVAGMALAVLGLIGLVLPVLPGVLLLAGAAACLSLASRRLRTRIESHLEGNRRYQRVRRRWEAGRVLSPWQRARLGFWLALAAVLPGTRY